jgi:hypothetical protein
VYLRDLPSVTLLERAIHTINSKYVDVFVIVNIMILTLFALLFHREKKNNGGAGGKGKWNSLDDGSLS